MFLKLILLQIYLLLSFISFSSSFSQEWLKRCPAFKTLKEDCWPLKCSDWRNDFEGFKTWICDCDKECTKYGTCCWDSRYAFMSSNHFRERDRCFQVYGSDFSTFMISSCKPAGLKSVNFLRARDLCENDPSNASDPLTMIPVTNPHSGKTYKNFFCSLCNFDDRGGILWNILLMFNRMEQTPLTPAEREIILNSLVFNESTSSWGMYTPDQDNYTTFTPIILSADVPTSVKHLVRRCNIRANSLVSRCSKAWYDAAVRRMCEQYLSPIRMGVDEGGTRRSVDFRNPHCALCNYVSNFDEAICSAYAFAALPPSLSFTLLLDVNPSDGDRVAETNPCAGNEVYDPFFKKCRSLVCALPGQVIRGGQCVKV